MKPDEDRYIYTDGIDYSETADSSVWGTEEKETAKLLETSVSGGKWLNLCAGDGRFNNRLLEKAETVIASDIDENALEKLVRVTPAKYKNKLNTKILNVVETFPFGNQTFDGIFCVGTLHLFPKTIFYKILNEMKRVMKADGKIIIDFATDIKRSFPDGSLWVVKNEPSYSLIEARQFLEKSFEGFRLEIYFGKSEPESVTLNDRKYVFTCNFIVLEANNLQK